MLKERLLAYLENQTAFFHLENVSDVFTAKKIAEQFSIKRNTVSHHLNQLNEEGKIVKITTRPVYFFHKEAFELQFFSVAKTVYPNLEELQKEQPLFNKKQDIFSLLIGHDRSLARSIEKLKSAAFYPDGGLPILLTGESGTGKSYMVRILHQFCLENELIADDAPLVTFNCAQYANNPELLTSNLFGHVKGAYTGAERDHMGAFESANGGCLFLDEVHRLTPEGQEKLFTYLDQGIIYRMGQTDQPKKINVRLVFATTEELTSTFLTTFIRRIPVQIELPALSKRTQTERQEMILSFFIQEQRKIGRPFSISAQVIHLLKHAVYSGNIGTLKNMVRVTVAKSFAEQRNSNKIMITIHQLPEELLRQQPNLTAVMEQAIEINERTVLESLMTKIDKRQTRIIETYEKLLTDFQAGDSLEAAEEALKSVVEQLFDFLLFETDRSQNQELLLFMTQYVREALKQTENSYQITFDGNSVYAVSYYLFQRSTVRWVPDDLEVVQLIDRLHGEIKKRYPQSNQYAERILELIKPRLDIDVFEMDRVILTLYLNKLDLSKENSRPRAIIVAHGYATASSIANVANRLLSKNIFESFDMPLNTTPHEIAEEVMQYVEKNDVSNGLVILVDMGSLKEIYQYFSKTLSAPLVIMNNVSTQLALAVGEKLQMNEGLEQLVEACLPYTQTEWEIIYPEDNKTKAILTTCFTGIGTAAKISQLLEKSLPKDASLQVIPYEFDVLEQGKKQDAVFGLYDVVGIIGTADPNIKDIPYLSLEELISGKGTHSLFDWLNQLMDKAEAEQVNHRLIRNFSLEKVIDSVTILDTEKVMSEIELFMRVLEELTQERVPNDRRLALYVHISCLIERLIRNIPIQHYSGYEALYQCHEKRLSLIKEAFSVIEKDYSVIIPDSEIAYIFDILFKKTDTASLEEEF